ncbi:MAG: 2-dehydro-3-deoxygalactonokinase [Flavisolibacter sp.]|nr:2-dehydro-3-deoxygalactonokinase [Flavisolibacter sp.]
MDEVNKYFLSCDWGTSTFRLRLVETENLAIIGEESSHGGIAATFEQWQQYTNDKENRVLFYLAIVQKHLTLLEQKVKTPLQHVPLIISGMASSTIGMMEVPYKELPFATDGSDLTVQTIKASSDFPHDIYLISGSKTDSDVMRGEETQLVGCINESMSNEEQLFIFPGTHSKHITVKNNKVVAFQTYMTGEFFDLLSTKSILSVSVKEGRGIQDENNRQSFEKGVLDSQQFNLLHCCFLVRTNQLFQKLERQQNYYYLSGLLIGVEIGALVSKNPAFVTLVSNVRLEPYYVKALRLLLATENIKTESADKAMIRGQFRIYSHWKQIGVV